MSRSAIALGVAALALSAARPARAELEPVRFAWVRGAGAEACAGQPRIAEQVAARLVGNPFSATAGRSIEALVSRDDRGFHATIYVRDAKGGLVGSRDLTSEAQDCASLELASALAIALAIDPDAMSRPPPAPAVRAARSAPVPVPAPAPLPAALSAPTPARRPLGASSVALRAVAGFGLLPRVAAGWSLAGQVALAARAGLTGEAVWLPEARTSDGRFGFGLAAFSLGACGTVVRLDAADLAACGALWIGALHAVVYDLTPAGPGDHAWAAASASPRLRVRIAPGAHLELGAHVMVPLVRRRFVVEGWSDPVFRQPPVTVLALGGLGANFL